MNFFAETKNCVGATRIAEFKEHLTQDTYFKFGALPNAFCDQF